MRRQLFARGVIALGQLDKIRMGKKIFNRVERIAQMFKRAGVRHIVLHRGQ